MIGLFICLLFMVGMRLSMDLRDRNAALAGEIAERQRLQGELCASLKSEKTALEEQRQLMRMVSHEFRTPLAAIRYARDMLEAVLERPQEAVSRRLQAIDEAVSRMTMLIDRFLTSERQGDGILKIDALDNVALARSVQQHFDRVGQGNRLHFTTVEEVPGYRADFEMLTTVLINLVDNALKYSGEESPVDIALFKRQKLFIMEVSDRGIGVPEEERSHLGRRFFRASNTGRTAGSGLGLHTCRQLVGYHDGTLDIRQRSGGGTVATVRLPLPGIMASKDKGAEKAVSA